MPRFREYLLWLVVNIRGMDIEEGDVIAEYIMPPPPEKKGKAFEHLCAIEVLGGELTLF